MAKSGLTNRRRFLALTGALAATPLLSMPGLAALATGEPLHALSAFGSFKYPKDFTHFGYANPDAPKGGTFNFQPPNWALNQGAQTFDTLNTFVLRGTAPMRMELTYDSLMVRALDEPDAIYGLLAETVTISPDRNEYTFRLRPEARFHDGSPVTAEDVAFTYELFRTEGHPGLRLPLGELEEARADDPLTVTLRFSGKQSDRAILTVATFPIVQKGFFEDHPFDGSELIAPMGSGPYMVGRFDAGKFIEYDRVKDYWAADLPVRRGLNHFDRIRIDYFRERQTAFEAFKKGLTHHRQEHTSKTWATEYNFPALQDGRVVKRTFPRETVPTMQAWALNTRRVKFADVRVREAIAHCFDFEWTREVIFYGSYERSNSLFEGSEFVATGMPSAEELALLEPWRGKIPDDVFGEPVMQPVSDGSGRSRELLRHAVTLLREAGWKRDGAFLANDTGERLSVELLVRSPTFVRLGQPFIDNMIQVGIDASIRLVDAAQFQLRLETFDFDMVGTAAQYGATPTQEALSIVFSSQSAEANGSRNFPGTADPAVDDLIARVGQAESRKELVTVMRALDRLLRARRDWIPNWRSANHWVAYWDMFGFDEPKPDYGFPVETLWWWDEEKAKAIGKG